MTKKYEKTKKMKTTKEVAIDFFRVILSVMAKNSSKSYALIVLKNIQKTLIKDFKFFKLVKVSDSTIKVDDMINSIDTKSIRALFIKVIDILGPNLLKLVIKERLDSEDIKYLNRIGVRF